MKENWQQVKEIFVETLGQKLEDRPNFISQKCGGNILLENEVKSLINSYHSAETFLETPAIVEVADTFGEEPERLKIGSFVNHYKILKQIGKGGMGEVYLAEDTKLDRKVALKILNNFFDNKHINLKRFVLEAKAASSLNHPNIVIIHEVGESLGTHYIVSEFIKGNTLSEIFQSKSLSLLQIIDISVQTVTALVAAHQLGIIHRDIKPDNIMLREDGIVKVLDFGLAKLTDKPLGEVDPNQKTREQMNTRSGMILGTTNYMSPEQARGLPIDTRTDIWSFGVVLYEFLSRSLPFGGETTSDIIASILKSEPQKLSLLNNNIPLEFERIVSKCLKKNANDRYQTSNDLLNDLKDFQNELNFRSRTNTLEFQTDNFREANKLTDGRLAKITDGGDSPNNKADDKFNFEQANSSVIPQNSYFPKALMWTVIALASFLAIGFYGWSKYTPSVAPPISFNNMKLSKLTFEGRTNDKTSISPDGKYVAYGLQSEGKESLMVRQVNNTAGAVEIIPPAEVDYETINFAPDGNSIYYVVAKPKSVSELYEIPVLGGTPRKILEDLKSSFEMSPDGNTFAFIRGKTSIILADKIGSEQKILSSTATGESKHRLSWRPDGKALVSSIYAPDGKFYLVEVSTIDGSEKRLPTPPWLTITGIKWLSDGSGIIISGRDLETQFSQIWFVAYPSGKTQRITNDLTSYFGVSLTNDNKSLVAIKEERLYNIWTIPDGKTENAKKITTEEGKDEGISGVTQNAEGKIIYTVRTAGKFELWSVNADGSENRQLTFNQGMNYYPRFSPDGKSVIFISDRTGNFEIWRMNSDGTNPVALTNTTEEEDLPSFTPDGKSIVYTQTNANNLETVWKMNLETGFTIQLTNQKSGNLTLSPDGKFFACEISKEGKMGLENVAIFPMDGGQPSKILTIPLFRHPRPIRWSADSKSLLYIDKKTQVHNIWSQPIDGSPAKQLTFFESGQITTFALGNDGKSFVLSRGNESSDVIIITNFR